MKIETIQKENKTIHSNTFDNLVEMVDYIKNTEPYSDIWTCMASLENDSDFSGVESLEEALDLCLTGYKINFSDFLATLSELNRLSPYINNKRTVKSSVYGFRPNISKVMSGNPNSMYKLVRKEENNFAKFYFNTSYGWNVTKEAIMHKGIITISLIKFLEQLGTRINLNFFEMSHNEDEYIYINVSLKKPNQPLDTSICTFPMCHPAFLRKICFAIDERTKVEYADSWDGPYGELCDKEDVTDVLNVDENSLLLMDPHSLGVSGKDIVEDTINFIQNSNFNKILRNGQRLEFDERQKRFILTK